MLIRIVLDNIFSFGEKKEFNMIPRPRLRTFTFHKYSLNNFSILKMSSIYGANGSGKSNLIKAIRVFQNIITSENLPPRLHESRFKFRKEKNKTEQLFAVEFIKEKIPFYYAIEISGNIIKTEELYYSGLGKKNDKLIFERKTNKKGETTLNFTKDFENDLKSQTLKSILLEEFIKPNKPILKLIANRDNKYLIDVKKAYNWFENSLQIIMPDSKPTAFAHKLNIDPEFKKYAEDIICSFNLGINSLISEKKEIGEFFGEDDKHELDELIEKLEESPTKMIGISSAKGDILVLVKEDEKYFVEQLKLEHLSANNITAKFSVEEESDGTIRLLDFIPALQDVISKEKVFFIDEIERSIHPLLIKELIRKFSYDENTKGQLIFTTHESNLLDQNLFRQDEIWFTEKNKLGTTDLYSLSDFKEHNTIDIRKGYLNGRYGSIPFLASLNELSK